MSRNALTRTVPRMGRALVVCGLSSLSVATLGAQVTPTALRVLFVGNSLTYTHDLPAMLGTVAEVMGREIEVVSVARPNFSLEDHWYGGIGARIESVQADVVVLQQGPSSLRESQVHLERWARRLAPVIRAAGGEPAYYMVWPSEDRLSAFDGVFQGYAGAALATGGLFIPAGAAWEEAWARDPQLALYGPDSFHPSPLGSAIAALTIARVLLAEPVDALPATLEPRTPGLPVIELGPARAVVLEAVEAAVARTRPSARFRSVTRGPSDWP